MTERDFPKSILPTSIAPLNSPIERGEALLDLVHSPGYRLFFEQALILIRGSREMLESPSLDERGTQLERGKIMAVRSLLYGLDGIDREYKRTIESEANPV